MVSLLPLALYGGLGYFGYKKIVEPKLVVYKAKRLRAHAPSGAANPSFTPNAFANPEDQALYEEMMTATSGTVTGQFMPPGLNYGYPTFQNPYQSPYGYGFPEVPVYGAPSYEPVLYPMMTPYNPQQQAPGGMVMQYPNQYPSAGPTMTPNAPIGQGGLVAEWANT